MQRPARCSPTAARPGRSRVKRSSPTTGDGASRARSATATVCRGLVPPCGWAAQLGRRSPVIAPQIHDVAGAVVGPPQVWHTAGRYRTLGGGLSVMPRPTTPLPPAVLLALGSSTTRRPRSPLLGPHLRRGGRAPPLAPLDAGAHGPPRAAPASSAPRAEREGAMEEGCVMFWPWEEADWCCIFVLQQCSRHVAIVCP